MSLSISNNIKTYLVSLIFAPISNEFVMPTRDTEFNITEGNLKNINNMIDRDGSLSITSLVGATGGVSGASMQPTGRAFIENGWETERFRYVLTLETERGDGTLLRSYVIGYTDSPEATIKGANTVLFGSNLQFIINNIVEVRGIKQPNGQINWVPDAAYNVMQDRHGNSYYANDEDLEYMLRPMDFMSVMSHKSAGHGGVLLPGSISANAEAASHTNRDANTHLVNLTNSIVRGGDVANMSHDVITTCLTEAKGLVLEKTVYSNPFIEILTDLENKHVAMDGFLRTNFTYSDLLIINGGSEFRNKIQASGIGKGDYIGRKELSPLEATTIEAKIIYDLINIMTGHMWGSLISLYGFTVTNAVVRDRMDLNTSLVKVSTSASYSFITVIDTVRASRILEHKMETIIFPQLCPPGMTLTLTAEINLLGNSTVTVIVDNRRPWTSEVPTFADNSYSNLRGTIDSLNNMVNTYETITQEIL